MLLTTLLSTVTPAGIKGGRIKTFAVYLMNDEIHHVDYMARMLKDLCALTPQGASSAITLIQKGGEAMVFEAKTEDEAWEVHTKLRQGGLTSEIRTRLHGEEA